MDVDIISLGNWILSVSNFRELSYSFGSIFITIPAYNLVEKAGIWRG